LEKNNLFTILTASYKKLKYIPDYIDSILAQTYRPLEVVFIDDASKDDTLNCFKQYYDTFKDANISLKLLRNKKQQFCSNSYDRAYRLAKGYFIGVLDSDDMLVPDAVEYIMNAYELYPDIGYIYTQFECCDNKMKRKKTGFCRGPKAGECLLDMGKRGIHAFSHWRTFSHRIDKLDKIWGPGLRCAVDKYMAYRLEEWSEGMFLNRICYRYRQGAAGAISYREPTKLVWKKVMNEARKRRARYKLYPKKIITVTPEKLLEKADSMNTPE
jgi:glycosyltransferase involved in cell wall biosynthesis